MKVRHERLGKLVRERRLALDLSQRDAAARAGISNQTWLNVENGRSANQRSLAKIERALGWSPGSIDAILAGTPPPSPIGAAPVLDITVLGNLTRLAEVLSAEDLTREEIQRVVNAVIEIVSDLRHERQSVG
jgi:transcriptional regulator with XRE-family HTH domain